VAAVAFTAATAYGGVQEGLQAFVDRTPGLVDGLCNAVGAALAVAAWAWARRRAIRRA
jgi:VanZ family protein